MMLIVRCLETTRFHITGQVVEQVKSIQKKTITPNELMADSMDELLSVLSI